MWLVLRLTFIVGLCLCQITFAAEPKKNIVLILADDLGFSDIGSFGSEVNTPNLDALAAEGVRFSNYHTAASCAPTRSMLMSGMDSHHAGVANMPESITSAQQGKPGYGGTLGQDLVSVATRLKDAGYHTYMTGKWHLGNTKALLPSGRGFERALAMADTGADNWEQKPYLPIYEKASWFEDGEPAQLPGDFYSSSYFVDKTIEYIESNRGDGAPFFSYLAFQAVHIPVQAPREFTEKYMGVYDAGWSELRKQRYKGAIEMGVAESGQDLPEMSTTFDWSKLSADEKKYQSKRMAVYAGMIDAMDFNIGRLISYLKDTNQFDNTVFIFVSDNGAEPSDPTPVTNALTSGSGIAGEIFNTWMRFSNYNIDYETLGEKGSYNAIGPSFASAAASPFTWYKFFAGEGGMRVPMIVSGLASPLNGEVVDSFSWVTSIVPTMLEIAGVQYSGDKYQGKTVKPITGRSLLPVLMHDNAETYSAEDVVGYELGGNAALFQGDYKIVKNRGPIGSGDWHLFNLNDDPSESKDLKLDQPERFETMMAEYDQYVVDHDVLPVDASYDQRRQVVFYGLNKRLGGFIPWVVGIGIVIVVIIFVRRRRRLSEG